MREEHNFRSPRNLFEKLLRESDNLEKVTSGDNFFNFIATACALKEWMKKSPEMSTEVLKRFLKRVSQHKSLNICRDILSGKAEFKLVIGDSVNEERLIIGDLNYDPIEVKNEILELFALHFRIKGQS